MLNLILDEIASERAALPAPAVAAISAGMHISTQEIKELTASDVDKSLTPAPSNAPMFERGAYLNPEPSKSWVNTPKNSQGQNEVLDIDTRSYLIKMHRAALNFSKTLDKNHALRKSAKPSLDDLKKSQNLLKRQANRFVALSIISTSRLAERASTIAPAVLRDVKKDTEDLSKNMDESFKEAIKNGDLKLTSKDANRLGNAMDENLKNLSSIESVLDKTVVADKSNRSAKPANINTTPSLS